MRNIVNNVKMKICYSYNGYLLHIIRDKKKKTRCELMRWKQVFSQRNTHMENWENSSVFSFPLFKKCADDGQKKLNQREMNMLL